MGDAAAPDAGAGRASVGRVYVELLESLDDEMTEARRAFPAVGPPPCAPPGPVEDIVPLAERCVGPSVRSALSEWRDAKRAFDAARARVEGLDHRARSLVPEEASGLAGRLSDLREARSRLDVAACAMRRRLADEIDEATGGR